MGSTSTYCPCSRSDFSWPHLLFPVCQKDGDPLKDGRRYIELGEFAGGDFRDDGAECCSEVYKQDPYISPWTVKVMEDVVQSHFDGVIH